MKHIPSDPHLFIITKQVKRKWKILIVPVYVDDLFPFGDKVLTDEFCHAPSIFHSFYFFKMSRLT